MKNNPTLDLIAETYMQRVAPPGISVVELKPDTGDECEHDSSEDCCQDDSEGPDDLQLATQLAAQLSEVLNRLGGESQSPGMFNVGVEDIQNMTESLDYPGRGLPEEDAEYQGRKVTLNKPTRGDVKKFKVYVKDPKTGNVKKVNFGHGGTSAKKRGEKTMKIRKSNPKARKSFRARHNCDNPGSKLKPRYWSCKAW
jgi:hypothetical protein